MKKRWHLHQLEVVNFKSIHHAVVEFKNGMSGETSLINITLQYSIPCSAHIYTTQSILVCESSFNYIYSDNWT
jgi:predicted ATP-dependent endonuclease of OLD family